ncbi:MAG: nucleotidyl transferase AbiEii/AbiGii toxin family protein, partial [Calditrichaeota bacterium]|nr:nucleotidyl transferase AbiEii/AbiGii toxin family protein [Calditrichota bacterium]
MIEKNEILKMAAGLGLNPDTVEKDYVLGWMLFGISQHREISGWALKGGTSLKKCFFETFRFSEDLDFTLSDQSHLAEKFLLKNFIEITDFLSEEVGIIFFKDRFKFKIIDKRNGKYSAQGKIHYNGPLRRKQGVATIKLDLTTDEILVLKTVRKQVHHPYTDRPLQGIYANCYAFEEVVAEKIRALAQRARPRDLYDVIHFFRNREMIENPTLVYNVLQKKCSYKKIEIPTFLHIQKHEKYDELEPQWKFMLAHQLTHLPPFASFWNDLSPFFDWLNGQLNEKTLVSVSNEDELIFHPGRILSAHFTNFLLQKIQFAAANRICIKLMYKSKTRTVEPISFRTSKIGNRLFYGFEREANHAKAYSISEIQSIEITNIPYIEKYPVEISSSGRISMPPIRRTSDFSIAKNESRYV